METAIRAEHDELVNSNEFYERFEETECANIDIEQHEECVDIKSEQNEYADTEDSLNRNTEELSYILPPDFVKVELESKGDNDEYETASQCNNDSSQSSKDCIENKDNVQSDDEIGDNRRLTEQYTDRNRKICDENSFSQNCSALQEKIDENLEVEDEVLSHSIFTVDRKKPIQEDYLQIEEDKPSKQNQQCYFCDYSTKKKSGLKRHIDSVHLKIKNHKCEQCSYSASRRINLTNHIATVHLKIKNHKCPWCPYSTVRKSDLQGHINAMHLKIRNHKCHLCEFVTTQRGRLRSHIDSKHLKVKNFKCQICKYSTVQSHHLKRHMKTVHSKLQEVSNDSVSSDGSLKEDSPEFEVDNLE